MCEMAVLAIESGPPDPKVSQPSTTPQRPKMSPTALGLALRWTVFRTAPIGYAPSSACQTTYWRVTRTQRALAHGLAQVVSRRPFMTQFATLNDHRASFTSRPSGADQPLYTVVRTAVCGWRLPASSSVESRGASRRVFARVWRAIIRVRLCP